MESATIRTPPSTDINNTNDPQKKEKTTKTISKENNPDHLATQKPPGPKVIKLFSYSTQLSTKFQLLIKAKEPINKDVYLFYFFLSLTDVVFIMLLKVKCQQLLAF